MNLIRFVAGLWMAMTMGLAVAQTAPETNAPPSAPADPKAKIQAKLDKLTKKYGADCLYEVNDKLKIIFATNADRHTLDDLKTRMAAFAQATQNDLFGHGLSQYLSVVVPKNWANAKVGGHFWPDYVDARTIGPTLMHEFTHALHFADQGALDQSHPVWMIEGLASLFEYSTVTNGHIVPRHNRQLLDVKEDIQQKKVVSWERMVKFEHKDYHSIHYPQGRYMLFYLHAQGMLKKFYDAYTKDYASDPTGRAALEKVFGKPLAEIDKDWVAWIQQLPEPPRLGPGSASIGVVALEQMPDGLKITEFTPASAAEKAGLQAGDVLLGIDGVRIVEPEELVDHLVTRKVGDQVKIRYRRDGQYAEKSITLSPMVPPPQAQVPPPATPVKN